MPYADPLTDAEVEAALHEVEGWERDGDVIRRTVVCRDFRGAVALVNAVADAAESANHHPDIAITGYKRVTFTVTTHAARAITRRDVDLARAIDELVRRGHRGAQPHA